MNFTSKCRVLYWSIKQSSLSIEVTTWNSKTYNLLRITFDKEDVKRKNKFFFVAFLKKEVHRSRWDDWEEASDLPHFKREKREFFEVSLPHPVTVAEKGCHFSHILDIHPQNLHCSSFIDVSRCFWRSQAWVVRSQQKNVLCVCSLHNMVMGPMTLSILKTWA